VAHHEDKSSSLDEHADVTTLDVPKSGEEPGRYQLINGGTNTMKKLNILRVTAATVLGVGFSAGVASAATTGTITGPTGPSSNNQVTFNGSDWRSVHNRNKVNVASSNGQGASTGSANVSGNTTGGSASSGDASNDNYAGASVSLTNSSEAAVGAGGGTMSGAITGATGPNSNNQVTFNGGTKVHVSNHNEVNVTSTNSQSASSGSANVSGNTTGGNASSGNASNVNTSESIVTVSN